jgi:hypothetical protein
VQIADDDFVSQSSKSSRTEHDSSSNIGFVSFLLSASVEVSGESAFDLCECPGSFEFEMNWELSGMETNGFEASGIQSIHIPRSVEGICQFYFRFCEQLISITFESDSDPKFSRIERMAFASSGLKWIHFRGELRVIGQLCLFLCRSLVSITCELNGKLSRMNLIQVPGEVEMIAKPWIFFRRSLLSITFD